MNRLVRKVSIFPSMAPMLSQFLHNRLLFIFNFCINDSKLFVIFISMAPYLLGQSH